MSQPNLLAGLFANQELVVDVETEAGTFEARSLRLREALSEVTRCEVEVVATADTDFEEILERPATVTLRIGGAELRRWTFVLGEARFDRMVGGVLRYRLVLWPSLWLLGLTKNVRKWRDETTNAIVDRVLDGGGVPRTWNLTRQPASRPYTVQYRESDLHFVQRLLEFEGIYYAFDEDDTLVLADRSAASPEVQELPYELLDSESALVNGDVGVTSFRKGTRVGSGRATVNDFHFKAPHKSLLSASPGSRDADLDVYDYPAGFRDPGAGAMLARLRREALEATKIYVTGESSVYAFAPARIFHFHHEEGLSYSGSYALVRVEHAYDAADPSRDRKARYRNEFFAIPGAVPFRPPLSTPRPMIEGNHTALVRGPAGEEIHTDVHGRFKVQHHWDREALGTDADSRWMRMTQEVSTSLVLSRVGWEVSLAYIDGDPDRPIGFARLINGEMTPSYAQPARKNVMTIKTESYPGKGGFNEIRMDDSASEMRMDFRAERDMSNTVLRNKTEAVGVDHHHLVQSNRSHLVQKNQGVVIGTNSVTMIGGDESPTVRGNRTDTVGGSEKVKVKGAAFLTVGNDDVEKVGGLRMSIVGGVSIPSFTPKAIAARVKSAAAGSAAAAVGGLGGPTLGEAAVGAATGGAQGALDALRGGAESRLAKAAEALATKGSTPLGSLGAPFVPPAGGGGGGGAAAALGGLASAAGLSVPGGAPDIAGALSAAVPSPASMLSAATGGLSDVRSPSDLLSFLHGAINRRAEKRFQRLVGGAEIKIAGGNITHEAGLVLLETVGGVKATITVKGGIEKSVQNRMVHLVGGVALRKAKDDYNTSSKKSDIRVGGLARLKAGEKAELRSKHVELEAATSFVLKSGEVQIELKPGETSIAGTMKFEAGGKINVIGGPDDLTS